jgi:hypothetical protein
MAIEYIHIKKSEIKSPESWGGQISGEENGGGEEKDYVVISIIISTREVV